MTKPVCRLAQWSDATAMADLAARAFDNNDLCGRYMHPKRHEYWDDFVTFWRRDIHEHFLEPNVNYVVSIVDERVVGAAKWKRQGKGVVMTQSWMTGPFLRIYSYRNISAHSVIPVLQQQYITLSNRVSSHMWPNRAADPTKVNCLAEAFPHFSHHWSGARQETWFLDMLCVHPDYQCRGHGRALVEWGKERARSEGICASTTSAELKEGFYEKMGFVEVGRANVGPIATVEGGAVMFCDNP